MKLYAENRKARHEYQILETFEGGLILTGAEVKSIREGGAKLDGAYVKPLVDRLALVGAHIRPYSKISSREGYDPDRTRTVLVSKKELRQIRAKIQQKGLTLVPISFYPVARRIKVSFALCRGKKTHDKRESLKERDVMRRVRRGSDE
jgi:SsrA-binding protein